MRYFILLLAFSFCFTINAQEEDYTKKMAEEHKNDAPVASPLVAVATSAVVSKDVVYAKIDGKNVTGYLAQPEGNQKSLPGIIVIQEWWGLNDNIKTMARKFAEHGYVALAVDMYQGNVADTPEDAKKFMQQAFGQQDQCEDNLKQAYNYLKQTCQVTRVGSVGWCFGGHWSLRTGMVLPNDLSAVVIYYGKLTDDKGQLAPLKMPILGIFGGLDKGIPVESVHKFHAALKELKKDVTIHIYENANHAFANPSGTRYHEESAKDAWSKTLNFFEKHLRK